MMLKHGGSVKSSTKGAPGNSLNWPNFTPLAKRIGVQFSVDSEVFDLNIFCSALHNMDMVKRVTFLKCVVCGSKSVVEIKCKIICRSCGYQEDCGDGVLG